MQAENGLESGFDQLQSRAENVGILAAEVYFPAQYVRFWRAAWPQEQRADSLVEPCGTVWRSCGLGESPPAAVPAGGC